MKNLEEKWRLEREVAQLFVESYNTSQSAEFVLTKHDDKPDFVASDEKLGLSVGIEITHLFYDEEEARLLLDKTPEHVLTDVGPEKLVSVLNNRLVEKSEKAKDYKFFNDMILVVRVASPVFDKATFDEFEKLIIVPPTTIFDQIWLLFQSGSGVPSDNLKQLK